MLSQIQLALLSAIPLKIYRLKSRLAFPKAFLILYNERVNSIKTFIHDKASTLKQNEKNKDIIHFKEICAFYSFGARSILLIK